MRDETHIRGAASVAVLSQLDRWEANLLLNLRLWCEGPSGRGQVWNDYARSFPNPLATHEMQAFETLMATLAEYSYRPLLRHSVHCACVGSDECILLNLIRTAADGHLNDAALIATLMIGPAKAETLALLAGQVGESARQIIPKRLDLRISDPAGRVRVH